MEICSETICETHYINCGNRNGGSDFGDTPNQKELWITEQNYFYPNPAADQIFFSTRLEDNSDVIIVSIIDSMGKTIRTISDTDRESITIGDLNPGIYFITTSTENGKMNIQKLIKI